MASFTIGATAAIFGANIMGSRQTMGDLQQFTCSVTFWDVDEWTTFQSLITTKYSVHVPLGGDPVVDIVNGPGEGELVIAGLGSTTAILTSLERSSYLPYDRSQGTATFLITGTAI
ncbi:MAG TPA: hypothetical protein VKB34_16645 [Povalibacter sp.]|nr:hypothetical protein [Povalibacter sp.]